MNLNRLTIEAFAETAKNYLKGIKHTTSDAQVKYQIAQLLTDGGYDYAEVLNCIYDMWMKTYPDFISRLRTMKWDNIFKHYIKEAEAEYDWSLAGQLTEAAAGVTSKGAAREEQLRTAFFNIMAENGIDTELMEKDMAIDLWGWIRTLDHIVYLADMNSAKGKKATVTIDNKVEETALVSAIEEKNSPTHSVTEKKIKKSRTRIKYAEIQQLSLDGEYMRSWRNISEAAKELGLNHASISKCISGVYKSAEGFRWVGIKEELSDTTVAA